MHGGSTTDTACSCLTWQPKLPRKAGSGQAGVRPRVSTWASDWGPRWRTKPEAWTSPAQGCGERGMQRGLTAGLPAPTLCPRPSHPAPRLLFTFGSPPSCPSPSDLRRRHEVHLSLLSTAFTSSRPQNKPKTPKTTQISTTRAFNYLPANHKNRLIQLFEMNLNSIIPRSHQLAT